MDPEIPSRFASADDIRAWAGLPPSERLTASAVARYRLEGDGRPIRSSVVRDLFSTAPEVEALLGRGPMDDAQRRTLEQIIARSRELEGRDRPQIAPAVVREQVGEVRLAARREVEAWEWMLDEHEPCEHSHDDEALDDVWGLGEPRCLAGWVRALRNALANLPSSFAEAEKALAVS